MPYHAMGYPDRATTLEIIRTLGDTGAELFEIGIPHSDPLADGPTIQTATYTALMQGTTVADCLAMTARTARRRHDTAILRHDLLQPALCLWRAALCG
jgi:tryptophan synthase alpha chain